jgi:hypothetical protein
MMKIGKCHLCGKSGELQDGHIFPKFAYKRFTSNLAKGGQFADLQKQVLSNKQCRRSWFCSECEQNFGASEDYVAQLCDKIDSDPKASQTYDERLLRFAVSIS